MSVSALHPTMAAQAPRLSDLRDALAENDRLHAEISRLKREIKRLQADLATERAKPVDDRKRAHSVLRSRLAAQRRADALQTTLPNRVRLHGNTWFDLQGKYLQRGAEVLNLGPTELIALIALLENRGTRMPAVSLAERVWGPDDALAMNANTIRTRISLLRQKLERIGAGAILPHSRSWGYIMLKAEDAPDGL